MTTDFGDAPNRNTLWARVLADELGHLGLEHVAIGSGSRSAPLVEALARDRRLRIHPHVDERSAAFFALGVGAATGRAAAVVTTSGTATANVLPATVEASQGEVPLLVLTADRPASLRGTDANQTIRQVGLYGEYPRLAIDLPLPEASEPGLARLREVVREAWRATIGVAPGPVHLNVPFEKPLEPTSIPGDVPDGLSAERGLDVADEVVAGPGRTRALRDRLAGRVRPLIACGPTRDPAWGLAALELGRALRCPVVADPLSGARFAGRDGDAGAITGADLFLGSERVAGALAPDLVIRLGSAPTSAAVLAYLEGLEPGTPVLRLDPAGRRSDHLGRVTETILADPGGTLDEVRDLPPADPGWLDRWREVDTAVQETIAPRLAREWFEGAIAAALARALPRDATWFIGNSMPIRDVDAFAGDGGRSVRTIGFRGASGIDGNVSGALGAATARGRPAAALIGDLTLLHDVGAVLTARPLDVPLVIVVIQNRGGGIFHLLPIRSHDPPFTPYIVMPHDVDLEAVARAAGIAHRPVASLDSLRHELTGVWERPGVRLLEAVVDRERNWAVRNDVVATAAASAEAAL
ncbi:MAG: 2-succinyl-5-enolpyruvyl-6-hydroxy-3-cyclohexene-1-carboxylic-acid synthase [Gemmatimonadetes bacterium]|nr:2-succinyl-5-enolpyruvyl-6-hydroxy-3-cyclohexene-1-carboxylic-acid synthase [Gemmatimonadota bacterium]